MKNFDAINLNKQATDIMKANDIFYNRVNELVRILNNLSDIIESEDSNLSKELIQLSSTYNNVKKKTYKMFDYVSNQMKIYANNTIMLETQIIKKVKNNSSNLDDINNNINSVDTNFD